MALRVGIVGAGKSGFRKAKRLEAYPDVQIVGIAEPSRPARDAFASTFGSKLAVSDHRRLASEKTIDLIYICSPPSTHASIAIDCLEAGKHVICLPPMAVNMKQAQEMKSAAERSTHRLFIALAERYDPVHQYVSLLIEDEKIGYPFMALAKLLIDDYGRLNDWHDWHGTWSTGGGGVLMQYGSGIIDLLQLYLGVVDTVSAVCTRFAIDPLNKAEDTCLLGLDFIEEASAEVAISGAVRYSAYPDKFAHSAVAIEIYGLDGSIQVTNVDPKLTVVTKSDGRRVVSAADIDISLPTDMDRDFLDCILEDREPLIDVENARDALRVLLAGYKSSQMKRRVDTLEQL